MENEAKNINDSVDQPDVNIEELKNLTKQLEDLQAELNSYKAEDFAVKKELAEIKDENMKLKEANYTLARHFDASRSVEDVETQMFKMFSKKGE